MRINQVYNKEKGFALISVVLFLGVFVIVAAGIMRFVSFEISMSRHLFNSKKAFYLAESGIQRAAAEFRATDTIPENLTYHLSETGLPADDEYLDNVPVNITSQRHPNSDIYEINSSAVVNGVEREVWALLRVNPPSKVFDYAYFINNWGWFYGAVFTVNGDVRSNGRFSFRDRPFMNGEIYAGGRINGTVRGRADTRVDGEYIYQHENMPALPMPNLRNLDYYEEKAFARGSSVTIGGVTIIDKVFGDDVGESGNIVLVGTSANPIVITGTVVITGDVVIKGTVSGQGTIYSGRNIYVAGNIEYSNPATYSSPPSGDPEEVAAWVAANANKDILGLAAYNNVILGNYTDRSWDRVYDYLADMGNEDVGVDGIPNTNDEGEGDRIFDREHEDLDGDGRFDGNYTEADVRTQADITEFANLPEGVSTFADVATLNISKIEGVLYTNRAIAGFMAGARDIIINGSLVSKDETIWVNRNTTFNYDERIHSRYHYNQNWLIDLGLPTSEKVEIAGWREEPAN